MKGIRYTVHSKTILGETAESIFSEYVEARKYFEKLANDKDMSCVEIYDRHNRLLLRWDHD